MNFYIGNNLELKVLDKNDPISGTKKIKIFENLALPQAIISLQIHLNLVPSDSMPEPHFQGSG